MRLGIGLLLSLAIIIAAVGFLLLAYVHDAEESILSSMEIQKIVLEMDRSMEKACQLYRDFFLQHSRIGLSQAYEQYVQPSIRQINQVIADSTTLKSVITQTKTADSFKNEHIDLDLFLLSARRFADTSILSFDLVSRLDDPERGLWTQLNNSLASLYAEIDKYDDLIRSYNDMKSYAQDYRIVRKHFIMQSALNAASDLRRKISHSPLLDQHHQERINNMLDAFLSVSDGIIAADAAVNSKLNDFTMQVEAVETVSETLLVLADLEVKRSQKQITHAHQAAFVILVGILIAGLTAGLGIAGMLNNTITRRVIKLTGVAEAFRNSNLDETADEEGTDELSLLGHTFNVMAANLRELINNLEQKVDQRTSELADRERLFRLFFEHSNNGVIISEACENGTDFRIMDINQSGEKIEGKNRQDLIGHKISHVLPRILEAGLLNDFCKVWLTGSSVSRPISYYSGDKLDFWHETSIFKLPTGEIASVFSDLTDQKRSEIEKRNMETKLHRAEKMESLGLLAGGVAHDLNNILSGLIGYPELLLMQIPADSELRKPISAIYESGQRAVAVVADLLLIARGVASVKTTASLNDMVMEYLNSPEKQKLSSVYKHVSCVTQLAPQLRPICCSPIHVNKCLMNLMTNAMEAIDKDDGLVVISTHNQDIDEETASRKGIRPGAYVVLSVNDNGKGIRKKDMEHIFEPFYTRKVMGMSGTGLGLAIVWNCIKDHDGTIEVRSEEEENGRKGTSFALYFPASSDEIAFEPELPEGINLDGRGEKILVVDDEPLQRDLASQMLTTLGYSVESVSSGEEAIAFLQNNRVDLVLLDMIMDPGINGRQTYEQLVQFHDGQKVVIASGFAESNDVKEMQQNGGCGFIKKPYTLEQLGRKIKKAVKG